ncbi:MAG TPA: PhoH family protein [Verrucomicrobiae bacterium]|jgi:phosphate starvation-inducible PhoH-like protein|nr:PhoH family protein [Verrucomicrobiae bacterium]
MAGSPEAVANARRVVTHLLGTALRGAQLTPDDVALAAGDVRNGEHHHALPETLIRTQRGKEVRPRTSGQRAFVEAIDAHPLTFGIGPAGTGKTYLAVTMAVRALRDRKVSRLILSRPAVEAGEKLGFLPGDVKEKVDPYMRPLYDALAELLDDVTVGRYLERGIIEIAPLAFMRGRTFSEAFVILDEAQNATREQLKMFLTRLGTNSVMVVNGDITQVDLPSGATSGLAQAATRLSDIPEIAVVTLTESDVVRHPLVAKIIRAYARDLA